MMSTALPVRLSSISLHRRGGGGGGQTATTTVRRAAQPMLPVRRTTTNTTMKKYHHHRRRRSAATIVRASSSSPSFESMCPPETYNGESNLWLTQELPRLLATLPKKRPCDGLVLTRGTWTAASDGGDGHTIRLNGLMRFHNTTKGRFDMFVPEVSPRVTLLSKAGLPAGVSATVRCIPRHEDDDPAARPDDHWTAYVVPVHGSTTMEVEIEITTTSDAAGGAGDGDGRGGGGSDHLADLATLDAAFLRMEYVVYGHHGRTTQEQQVVLPLRFPEAVDAAGAAGEEAEAAGAAAAAGEGEAEAEAAGEEEAATTTATETKKGGGIAWREVKPGLSVLCVPTHLLCHMDDPVSVVQRYVQRHAEPGDMVSIGETPLAAGPGSIHSFVCSLCSPWLD